MIRVDSILYRLTDVNQCSFLMRFRHATTCCCAKINLGATSTWSTSFLGGSCKSTTVPKLQYPFFSVSVENLISMSPTKRCLPLHTVSFKVNRHYRCTSVRCKPTSIRWILYRLKPTYSSFVWCHNVVMWRIPSDQFYQTGQCRNLRIKLTLVDDPDLDRHWLMIVDG